jgi:predicted metal-dependent phosphoesterase TrpH
MTIQRVLLHNHSTWSDGHMSLSTIARLGELLGASAVVMSEHDYDFTSLKWDDYIIACRQASTQKCTVVPGIEYSSHNGDIHIVTVGTPCFHGTYRDLVDTITAVRAEGGAAVLAHPRRRDCFDKITNEVLAVLDGVEIWNRKVDGLLPARLYFEFARSHALATTVGMDLHAWRQIFPMWNEIDAGSEPLDGKIVATALRQRKIAPACILGELAASLEGGFSIALGTLASAERARCILRDTRDVVRANFNRSALKRN